MKVTLLLADYAKVSDGKLDVLGGGWSIIRPQGQFGFCVAGLVQVPWDQANVKHRFRLDLLDADGGSIPTSDGENEIHAEGEFETGRPPGLIHGTPLDVPFIVPFGPLALAPGRYEVRMSIDGKTEEDWRSAFTVTSALPQILAA